jgi:hypothetical protein
MIRETECTQGGIETYMGRVLRYVSDRAGEPGAAHSKSTPAWKIMRDMTSSTLSRPSGGICSSTLCRRAHGTVNLRLKLDGDEGPELGDDWAIDSAASRCFSVEPALRVGAMRRERGGGMREDVWLL